MRSCNGKDSGADDRPCSAPFRQLRKAQGLAQRTRTVPPGPPVTAPTVQCFTPRQATWLTLRQPKDVTAEEQHLLTRVHHAHAAFAQAIGLAHSFAQLLRARQAGAARGVVAASGNELADRVSARSTKLPARLCGGQSRGDLAVEYQPGRGAHQSPEDAETPDVWPSAPRSPQPARPPRSPRAAGPGGRPRYAVTGGRRGSIAMRTTRSVVSS
jgi:hypothetical protein